MIQDYHQQESREATNNRSCPESVACAVAIQCDMAQNAASVSSGNRIEFRVGINLGDAIVDEDDIPRGRGQRRGKVGGPQMLDARVSNRALALSGVAQTCNSP